MAIASTNTRLTAVATRLAIAACLVAGGAGAALVATRSQAAGTLSATERLVAQDEIRQKVILFGLLADGDFVKTKDIKALTEQTLAPDAVTEMYDANGVRTLHVVGRDPIVKMTSPPKVGAAVPWVSRHYMVSTYFDDITASTAKTRSTAVFLKVTKNKTGADCPTPGADACSGQVTRANILVYHDDWAKTPEGWRKVKSELRGDD